MIMNEKSNGIFLLTDVKYLQSGLRSRLEEHITKMSPKLGRDAVYTRKSRISRLPAYLSIQFVRFQYKEKASTNAKILKDIKFTISLDVFELCTPELQNKLLPMREKFKDLDDKAVEEAVRTKGQGRQEDKRPKKSHPFSFPNDIGSNNSGFYELQAVLTHKGRSSNSGHYLGWVRGKRNEWFKCDDEDVTLVTEEEVLKLSGGG
jgi:ubiquitin carboxyl-terminal hydrolase 14